MRRLFLTVLSVALVCGCASDIVLGNSPNDKVRVEGTVTDPDGAPMKGVRVSLFVENVSPAYDSDVTGDKGRYVVAATVAEYECRDVKLVAEADGHQVTHAVSACGNWIRDITWSPGS